MAQYFWKENIQIKNFSIPRFMSAPMDGVTDSPFRQLIRIFSPDALLFTEMRHVATIANSKKQEDLRFKKIEQPLCFQISANSTNFITKALERILPKKFDMLNLNAGCPAKKVIKSESGSALMAKPKILEKIILKINETLQNKIPFSLKIRAGFKEKNAIEIAKMAQDLGIVFLIIHPRTQSGGFTSDLDFEIVKKIKESIKIPVIFSGNIIDFASAKYTHEQTGVDGFMIGRALYGAPWKIHQIMQEALGKTFIINNTEKLELALKHLQLNSEFYGEKVGFKLLKKHVCHYIKNIVNAAEVRNMLSISQTEQEMENYLKDLLKKEK